MRLTDTGQKCYWFFHISIHTGLMRFYLKYNSLPALSSSDVVIYAAIQMYKAYESSTVTPVYVHKVTDTWNSETITWSNKPNIVETVEDYAIVDSYTYKAPSATATTTQVATAQTAADGSVCCHRVAVKVLLFSNRNGKQSLVKRHKGRNIALSEH